MTGTWELVGVGVAVVVAVVGAAAADEAGRNAKRRERELYQTALGSDHWRALKAQARERAGDRCERRGCDAGPDGLDLHHWTYVRRGAELLEDVQLLCKRHHRDADRRRRRYGRFARRR